MAAKKRGLARRLAAFIGARFRYALASLWVVALLASFTLVLASCGLFKSFDDGMLAVVASLKPLPSPDEPQHDTLVTLIISQQMFEAELNRQLPIDKALLGGVLQTIAKENPGLIAIDVDAVPYNADPSSDAATSKSLYPAIEPLLKQGISVVAVSYPRLDPEERSRARQWRQKFCEAADRVEVKEGRRPGRLYWASTWLESEGRGLSVLRYFSQGQVAEVAAADESLLPLGLVLAAVAEIAGPHRDALATTADYCEILKKGALLPASEKKLPSPEAYINYFGNTPLVVEMAASGSLQAHPPLLHCKAVVLGVNSFEGVDEHVTPVGQLPGAALHALVAASVRAPLTEGHLPAFMVDILAGYLFVVLFLVLHGAQETLVERAPEMKTLAAVMAASVPLIPMLVLGVALLSCAPWLASRGLWLNPLPIAIGLLMHMYIELTHHGRNEGHPPQSGFAESWTSRLRLRELSVAQRLELASWLGWRVVVVSLHAAALYFLFIHDHHAGH